MNREIAWPRWAVALASTELLGCALLVVPHTRRAGAIVLAAALAAACVLHAFAGERPPLSFAVDAAALLVMGRRDR